MENTPSESGCLELRTPRLFDRMLQALRQYRYAFFSALIVGFFCYMFAFTNKLVNYDDLNYMFCKGASTSSARWGLDILSYILPDYSMPWFHGVIALLLYSCGVCCILHFLRIEKPILQVLTAGLIISFPSLIDTFAYMFTTSSYGIAFLLAILAAMCFARRNWYWGAAGLICCIFSLSIYQAYIAITASLLVMFLIRRTMYSEDPVKKIFLQGLYFVAMLCVSLLVYLGLTLLIQKLAGISMSLYAQRALGADETTSVLLRPVTCIKMLAYALLSGYRGLIHEGLSQILHLIAIAILLAEAVVWCCRTRKADRILMALFLFAVLPFALTSILLFTTMFTAHTLVMYGMAGMYVAAALLLENQCHLFTGRAGLDRLRSVLLDLVMVSMVLITYRNCATANQAYLNLHLHYENTYSMATALSTRIEELPGFTTETPVALIGFFPDVNDYDRKMDVDRITGVSGFGSREWLPDVFLQRYCGSDFNYLDFEHSKGFIDTVEFQDMDFFPASDSVRMIGGTVVVKLDPWLLPEPYLSRIVSPEN